MCSRNGSHQERAARLGHPAGICRLLLSCGYAGRSCLLRGSHPHPVLTPPILLLLLHLLLLLLRCLCWPACFQEPLHLRSADHPDHPATEQQRDQSQQLGAAVLRERPVPELCRGGQLCAPGHMAEHGLHGSQLCPVQMKCLHGKVAVSHANLEGCGSGVGVCAGSRGSAWALWWPALHCSSRGWHLAV